MLKHMRTVVQRRQLDIGRGGAGAKNQRRACCQAQQQACTPLLLLLDALLGGCKAKGGGRGGKERQGRGFPNSCATSLRIATHHCTPQLASET